MAIHIPGAGSNALAAQRRSQLHWLGQAMRGTKGANASQEVQRAHERYRHPANSQPTYPYDALAAANRPDKPSILPQSANDVHALIHQPLPAQPPRVDYSQQPGVFKGGMPSTPAPQGPRDLVDAGLTSDEIGVVRRLHALVSGPALTHVEQRPLSQAGY